MDRSRSKRNYYHDQDSSSPPPRPSKPRSHGPSSIAHHRRSADRRPHPPPPPPPPPPPKSESPAATTFYRILCADAKIGAVIGKSGSIIKSIRHDTGAWITVHPLAPGDDECVIETSDNRRREPDGRPPHYSPAQEALLLVHERILDAEGVDDDEEGEYWERERGRVTTRLVVPRMHVGCLMGKGGKIIEQMRIETKTHIRILPRDGNAPRCVSLSEEIVQVVGDASAVKKAVAIISSRLKESLHRDRGHFRGRLLSPDRVLPDDDFGSYGNTMQQFPDGSEVGSRSSGAFVRGRNNSDSSRASEYAYDCDANNMVENTSTPFETVLFRILCPNDKVERVVGESGGILDMLQNEVGVDISISDAVAGSDECIIMISSEEGPDDELFPAQEALLHIQSCIVDLDPDKNNIITTRLLIPVNEIAYIEGGDGHLSEIQKLTSASITILPKEESPLCVVDTDQLVQIVGEVRVARKALVHITSKLRDYLYHEVAASKDYLPSVSGTSSPDQSSREQPSRESSQPAATAWRSKDVGGFTVNVSSNPDVSNLQESKQRISGSNLGTPVFAKKILEVIIPEHAVHSLTGKSSNKLLLISEMSGATVSFIEDRPDSTQKVIRISGNPEQAERAQSLLQGFILSTLDDVPTG